MNKTIIFLLSAAVVLAVVILTVDAKRDRNVFEEEKAQRSLDERKLSPKPSKSLKAEANRSNESAETEKVRGRNIPRIVRTAQGLAGANDPRTFQPHIPGVSNKKTPRAGNILDSRRRLDPRKITEAKRLFQAGNLQLAGKLVDKLETEMKDAVIVDHDFAEFAVRYSCTVGDDKRATLFLHMVSEEKKDELKDFCVGANSSR